LRAIGRRVRIRAVERRLAQPEIGQRFLLLLAELRIVEPEGVGRDLRRLLPVRGVVRIRRRELLVAKGELVRRVRVRRRELTVPEIEVPEILLVVLGELAVIQPQLIGRQLRGLLTIGGRIRVRRVELAVLQIEIAEAERLLQRAIEIRGALLRRELVRLQCEGLRAIERRVAGIRGERVTPELQRSRLVRRRRCLGGRRGVRLLLRDAEVAAAELRLQAEVRDVHPLVVRLLLRRLVGAECCQALVGVLALDAERCRDCVRPRRREIRRFAIEIVVRELLTRDTLLFLEIAVGVARQRRRVQSARGHRLVDRTLPRSRIERELIVERPVVALQIARLIG
jgi:hypothetical protein